MPRNQLLTGISGPQWWDTCLQPHWPADFSTQNQAGPGLLQPHPPLLGGDKDFVHISAFTKTQSTCCCSCRALCRRSMTSPGSRSWAPKAVAHTYGKSSSQVSLCHRCNVPGWGAAPPYSMKSAFPARLLLSPQTQAQPAT